MASRALKYAGKLAPQGRLPTIQGVKADSGLWQGKTFSSNILAIDTELPSKGQECRRYFGDQIQFEEIAADSMNGNEASRI